MAPISATRMSLSTQELDAFRDRHVLHAPIYIGAEREAILLEPKSGLRLLEPAPAASFLSGAPPSSSADTHATNRYLWVIDLRCIPYVIEAPLLEIGCALPKHTNLTGGGEAYLGGEMWFVSEASLYVSGGSGRYPPSDGNQLEEAAKVFQSFGYEVTSLGWNALTGRAKRVLEAA